MAGQDKTPTKKEQELLTRIRDRYKVMYEADDDNRREAMDDMKFANVPGHQWDENMKQERGERPCYEFNKIRVSGKRVINEIRSNRPQGKVRGVEGGDKEVAEIYDGLIRNISNTSDFETIQDYAAEYQVNGGMGAWRVTTEYSSDTAFDQDIVIEPIKNPFCLFCDPQAQDVLKRDADDWVLTEKISKEEYETRYPNHEPIEFESDTEFDDDDRWEDEETVRIAEYWWREPVSMTICMLEDGTVIDKASDEYEALAATGVVPVKEREVQTHKIMMCIASGKSIVEQPVEWAGKEFPFVMVFGEYLVIDGKTHWWGLPRFAKDAQRSYNVSRTAITETIAQAPKSSFWATPEQAKGHTGKWAEAHRKNYPYMLFNPDPKQPGPPQRMGGAEVPIALIQESQIASQEIRDVTGLHEASFGEESNEKSGVALARKQRQGAIVTYNYPDNMAKAVKRTWEILIDLIPQVYDTARELRILGSDGAEDYKKVNQVVQDPTTAEAIKVNDLSQGRYDITVTTGPSFATQREEAVEVYAQLGQQFPAIMEVAGDLVMKSMDLPYSEDIADRIQTLLPPQVQQMISQGKEIPPEVQQMMAQAQAAMQQVEQHGMMVQEAAAEAEKEKMLAEKAKAEVREAITDLEAKKATIDAEITKKLADLTLKQASMENSETTEAMGATREALSAEMAQAMTEIHTMVAEFMQASVQTLAEIQAKGQPVVMTPPQQRIAQIRAKRVNGELVAEPVYAE